MAGGDRTARRGIGVRRREDRRVETTNRGARRSRGGIGSRKRGGDWIGRRRGPLRVVPPRADRDRRLRGESVPMFPRRADPSRPASARPDASSPERNSAVRWKNHSGGGPEARWNRAYGRVRRAGLPRVFRRLPRPRLRRGAAGGKSGRSIRGRRPAPAATGAAVVRRKKSLAPETESEADVPCGSRAPLGGISRLSSDFPRSPGPGVPSRI